MRRIEFAAGGSQRLLSQLGSLRSGCVKDLTTPLLPRSGEVSAECLRSRVAESLSKACGLRDLGCARLRSLEASKLLKHGPFSTTPGYFIPATVRDSLEDQIGAYFKRRPVVTLLPGSAAFATERVRSLYPTGKFGRLRLLNLEDAAASHFPSSTGLGFPVISSDSERYLYEVYKISEEIHNSGYDLSWVAELPAVLGKRGQPRGVPSLVGTTNAKTRVIYAMPRALMNVEKRIQSPLQSTLSRREEFSAWVGRSSVAKAVTRLFALGQRTILSVDFKAFDVSVPETVIHIIFSVIKSWFTGDASAVIDFTEEAFTRTGILVPGGYFPGSSRSGGVPSGSVNTNLIDSLVNLWVMYYAAHATGQWFDFALAQGDDGVYAFRGGFDLQALSEVVSTLGMTISTEKSMVAEDAVHFLQDLHTRDRVVYGFNVGQRPLMHILNSAMSYERVDGKSWDRISDTVRWLQQWVEALYHPAFTAACDWLYDHDWMCADVVGRIKANDLTFLYPTLSNVNRKDSNSFKYRLTPAAFVDSPVITHLLSR